MLFNDVSCSGKAWVLTLEIDNKWTLDERSSPGLGAKDSMANIYEGFPEERAW